MTSTEDEPHESAEDRERRRRLRAERLLGDLSPSTTADERPTGWGEREDDRDAELRRDRPPHHEG